MPDDALKYNVRWMENTFGSRSVTEALLSPERESGNITPNDYEAATNFLPGFHRHYRFIGGFAGVPLIYTLRKPSWSNARTYLFLTSASFAGFAIGHVLSLSAHFNFVRSIEYPVGFSQAMDNIQRNLGGFVPHGPVIVRKGEKWAVDHDPEAPALDLDPVATRTLPGDTPTSPPTKPPSKWDQIRAANTRGASNSSWDALRQNHERARMDNPNEDPKNPGGDDRAAEQAKFDALLEKERNIK